MNGWEREEGELGCNLVGDGDNGLTNQGAGD